MEENEYKKMFQSEGTASAHRELKEQADVADALSEMGKWRMKQGTAPASHA